MEILKIHNNAKNSNRIPFLAFLVVFAIFLADRTHADDTCKVACDEQCASYTDPSQNQSCRDQCKKDEDTCESLAKKAAVYENILKLNNKQQDTLKNQIDYINGQQAQTQQNLQDTSSKLDDLTNQIRMLENNIQEKENGINQQKEMLKIFMRSYYDYDQQGLLKIVLIDQDLSATLSQSDYIQQSQMKATDVLEAIKNSEKELLVAKENLQKDYADSSQLRDHLQSQKNNLVATENQKQSLLVQTQGQEQKYQALLDKIKQQQQELFNFSSFGSYSLSADDRPDSADMLSNSWYYSQKDSRWADMKIGVSSETMKDYGCAITSVAMVYTYYGDRESPKDILKDSRFDGSLIYWPKGWNDTGYGYANYKSKLDSILNNDDVAIVHLTFSGGGHFVVVGGKDDKDYIIHDPYFGSNIYLGASLRILHARVDRIIWK